MAEPTIFEKSKPGKRGYRLPDSPLKPDLDRWLPQELRRKPAPLPELSEPEVVRHYTRLSQLNYGVDTGFYPLGSCTMKYNPKAGEDAAALPGFTSVHPLQPEETAQGWLELLHRTERMLCEVCGVARFSLQPSAGAQGELTGMLIIRAYHRARGEERNTVLIPDSAHGTNPASAALSGCRIREVKSNAKGRVDLAALRQACDSSVAGLMLTNPNTLGLFEDEIMEIAEAVHQAGGLLYYDGANLNAIAGRYRPSDMGFDVVHLNLHKTFGTPHGGGGPGSGPVGVKRELVDYLPVPVVAKEGDRYRFNYDLPHTIGRLHEFYGNSAVVIKAYIYLRMLGAQGLRAVSENAVLNANYLMRRLQEEYELPYDYACLHACMHEFVLSASRQKEQGVPALDIAKRLMDYGFHPPTIYFPLIVPEALMIEPTETESKETLDAFAHALIEIAREVREHPELLHQAPHNTPIGRLDEALAAKQLDLCWSLRRNDLLDKNRKGERA